MNILIVGGGKVGTSLAGLLLAGDAAVTVIEANAAVASRLQQVLPADSILSGSGSDPVVLEKAGIRKTDVVAAVTGDDETNLVVAGLARFEFSVRRIIARVNHPANSWMFTREMGVDVALNQADLLAHLILEELSVGEMMTLFKLRKGAYVLVDEKVHPRSSAAGKTIASLALPAESVITAIIRNGSLLIPRGDHVLLAEDEVLALVHSARLAQLAQVLGPDGHDSGGGQP